MRLVVVVMVVVLSCTEMLSAAAAAAMHPFGSGVIRVRASPPHHTETALVLFALAEMLERSPTFAELVRGLENVPDLIVYVRVGSLAAQGLHGRAVFDVAPSGVVVGQITIHRFRPVDLDLRLRAIAHELGHAYEVACLPRSTTSALHDALTARAAAHGKPHSMETPFAAGVEMAVLEEWFQQAPTHSRLRALARQFRLADCPVLESTPNATGADPVRASSAGLDLQAP
jgi:hypothetical protein